MRKVWERERKREREREKERNRKHHVKTDRQGATWLLSQLEHLDVTPRRRRRLMVV
jgi:hypothetical protein